ncbi:MAG: UDP-N-acetylmuramoyl-tripeptide--D-alanyl-D-alanine ligase, partial [Clostridia bacterium]|nr:UDP-N-acetylmuramoyl-tripeptide--D-alanyl-D-alanine ligase [Clostridia bacterium]
ETICLPQPGEHSVYNALAAIAGGFAVDAELPKMARALETFSGTKMRLNIQKLRDFRVIEDCYNASPASVAVALRVLADLKCGGKRIAVLGNMNELGDYAKSEHERVGRMIAELNLDFLVAVGDLAKGIAEGAVAAGFDPKALRVFDTNLAASAFLNTIIGAEDVVLVKGSHSTHLEEIIKALG